MANVYDWYFEQTVTEAEMDEAFANLETATHNLVADQGYSGVYTGLGVVEATVPDLTVDVAAGTAYDQTGQRISIPTLQNLDVSVDSNASSTAVTTGGNEKWVSVFVKFKRALSDQRFDGNGSPVFFRRDESFEFEVVQGAEAVIPTATRPALISDGLLIADIRLINAQTQIMDTDIESDDTATDPNSRFQYAFNLTASSPATVRVGPLPTAMQAILTELNNHIADVGNAHAGGSIDFDASNLPIPAAWSATAAATDMQSAIDGVVDDLDQATGVTGAELVGYDATALPVPAAFSATAAATDVRAAIDGIVDDLAQATGVDGSTLVGHDGSSTSSPSFTLSATAVNVNEALEFLKEDLDDATGDDGASRVGYDDAAEDITASNVADALDDLSSGWGKLDRTNTWSAQQTHSAELQTDALLDVNGNVHFGSTVWTKHDPAHNFSDADLTKHEFSVQEVSAVSGTDTDITLDFNTAAAAGIIEGMAMVWEDNLNDSFFCVSFKVPFTKLASSSYQIDSSTDFFVETGGASSESNQGGSPTGGTFDIVTTTNTLILRFDHISATVTKNFLVKWEKLTCALNQ